MTRHTRSALLLVAGLASTACGPYLERHVQSRTAQEVSVRCTQGPLEFSLRTLGARWGEGFRLYACSPRDIQGRFRIVEDGAEDGDGTWGAHKTVRQWVAGTASGSGGSSQGSYQHVRVVVEHPDNARCVASADELPGLAGTVAVTPIEPDGAVATVGAAGTDEEAEALGGLVEVAAAPVALVPAAGFPAQLATEPEYQCISLAGKSFYHVAHRFWSNQDPGATATTPGRELAIRLWFIEPNDLEGVVFVLDQFVETPSCTDEEWIAHLEEERLEREAEQREREAEWQAEQAERERERAAWSAHCAAHHEDEECWGPGGYDGAVARAEIERAAAERRALEAALSPSPEPTPAEATPEPPPEPHDPEGPPPAAPADPQPPKPSANAEWVPGYWHWSGFAWGWIAGWWRVPEGDLEAGLTVHAPEAPPALREETPPTRPAANAVWTAGFWQWDEAAWVWVKGSWQLPPQPAATWRPAEWRVEAAGAVFVPGGWSLRLGP